MRTANFTEHNQQIAVDQLCSPGLTTGLHGHLTLISVFNSVLSLTAFLGNALIVTALHKVSSLHPPSKLLLRCLATTDLCVGPLPEPLFVTVWMSMVNEQRNICVYVNVVATAVAFTLTGVSLYTMTAISVDRLLALLLRLRYKQIITLKRTYVTVITFWVAPIAFSAVLFWNSRITLCYAITGISLCLVTSVSSYTKIFLNLRHHQNQVQGHIQQPNQANQLNMERYKKVLSTAIWLQLTMAACYLPSGIVMALIAKRGLSLSIYHTWNYVLTLVFLNSSLNPILYCWKIEEVRRIVKSIIRQVLCHCFPS